MGSGSILKVSWKQKIVGRISTESRIVGADDALPQCLWSRYFIEGHGYTVEEIKFIQDNMSAMLMEKNGKESSMNQKNRMKMQYLFDKDYIENWDLSLKYCPTGGIYADFFTKPLQGATFRRFQATKKRNPREHPVCKNELT